MFDSGGPLDFASLAVSAGAALDPDELLAVAEDLVDSSAQRGVTLRILGSLGIRRHMQGSGPLLDLLERVPTRDIDFMGYSRDVKEADRMFSSLGYTVDAALAHSLEYDVRRRIYHKANDQLMAEIFLDELRMAHTLDFRGRLELDSPTITLIDLLLSKLQIQQITEKDLKDLIALLASHELGSGDPERIDVIHMLRLTSDDWGLHQTATTNLGIVKEWLGRFDVIAPSVRTETTGKIEEMIRRMKAAPKSLRWKMRSVVGTRVRWYEEVGEVHR